MKPPCPTTPHKRLAALWDRVSKTPKSSHSKSYAVVETSHKRPAKMDAAFLSNQVKGLTN